MESGYEAMAKCIVNISKYRYNFKSKNQFCLQNLTYISATIHSNKHEVFPDKYVILSWELLYEFKCEIFHELEFSGIYDLF